MTCLKPKRDMAHSLSSRGINMWWADKQYTCTEGLFIESWSGSAGYSAEMLTEDGKSWRVEDESTLASSVNIEAEYPALADHEELA